MITEEIDRHKGHFSHLAQTLKAAPQDRNTYDYCTPML